MCSLTVQIKETLSLLNLISEEEMELEKEVLSSKEESDILALSGEIKSLV